MFLGSAVGFVCFLVHEAFEFGWICHLNGYYPVGHGIVIDETWIIYESLVDVYDSTADRGEEVGCGLDASSPWSGMSTYTTLPRAFCA